MARIPQITANSDDGGDVYRLLVMVHSMAGSLANSERKEWHLARTNSDPMYGPIVTVWTNGIVDIEARTWRDEAMQGNAYHEYTLSAVVKRHADTDAQEAAGHEQ